MDLWEKQITDIIAEAKAQKEGYANKWLRDVKKYDKVCIFGAGAHGMAWYHILKSLDLQVEYFCDNNEAKWGTYIVDHVMCVSPEQCKEESAALAIIIAVQKYSQIYEQVLQWSKPSDIFIASINRISFVVNYEYMGNASKLDTLYERIMKVMNLYEDEKSKAVCCQTLRRWLLDEEAQIDFHGESYFYTEYIDLSPRECLVDAGAFDGDTIQSFIEVTKNQFERIYAFEMDKRNFKALKDKLGSQDSIELYPIGLSDQKNIGYYDSNFHSTVLSDQGTEQCETDCLDHVLENKTVTMIKMDIEGSEKKALKGAETIIREQKPKLAICIYHSADDFLDIPIYLKELNPEYKIFIRHHSTSESETVCYAY